MTQTPVSTSGLRSFQEACARFAKFFQEDPSSNLSVWIYLLEDGAMQYDVVDALESHMPHWNEQVYPLASFCKDFPRGLPFLAANLATAYFQAERRRASRPD